MNSSPYIEKKHYWTRTYLYSVKDVLEDRVTRPKLWHTSLWSGHSPWAQLQNTYHLPVLYTSFLLLNQFISIHINFLIFYFNSGLNHRPQLNWVQSHTNTTMYKWKIWILIYKLMVCIIGRNPICLFRVGNRSYEFKMPWLAYDLTIYDVSLLSVHESIMIYIRVVNFTQFA